MTHRTLTIDLLRHGEVIKPAGFFGSTDIRLSHKGETQMAEAIGLSSLTPVNAPWDHIISSPMQRCRVFAEKLAQQIARPLHIDPSLREMHFGTWEGLNAASIEQKYPVEFQRYLASPLHYPPTEGEPVDRFIERITVSWQNIKQQYLDQRILIVSHSGVIRTLLCSVLNCPPDTLFSIHCPYACYSQIRHFYHPDQQRDQLVSHNSRLEL